MKTKFHFIFLFSVLVSSIFGFISGRANNYFKTSENLATSDIISLIPSDSLRKNWVTTKSLTADSSRSIAKLLLDSNSIFKEFWNNEELFVYKSVTYASLPIELNLKLVSMEEEFVMSWYGLLYWGFGPRWGRIHRGLDLYLQTGDTIVAAFDGVVRYARFNDGGYGNCIIIRHLNGLETLYGHMSKLMVTDNEFVKAGQLIGLGGSTGRSNGPHLHFETRYKDFSFDPFFFIDSLTHALLNDSIIIYKGKILPYRYPSENPPSAYVKKSSKKNQTKFGSTYIVKKGDTISSIAGKYGMTVKQLKKINRLKSNYVFKGQILKIR